ncbi:hypothetical protein DYB37_009047 [Aphanomyces astaci]|uniref:Uncharacterized protein n=1 Tax=Aphanomyces astaci TaxID=112090 RepID=A0A418E9J2_APHAT|nr:hypothetical protein DYB37_009047 [Aphanomyces astaci]
MSETFEERKSRLQHRREGRRRVQQDKSNELTASEAQCTTLDEAGLLHECSKDIKSKILRELGFSLGPSGMDQCVCCVCDRLVFATTVHVYSTEGKGILQSMAARLRNPDAKLSAELVAFYDCKDIHPSFVELMLSRKGITHAGNVNDIENPSDVNFNVCFECESVLLQPWLSKLPRHYVFPNEPVDSERDIQNEFDDNDDHSTTHADEDNDGSSMDALIVMEFPDFSEIPVESWPLPPKHAIANHFFVGELPDELFKATWAEMLMCSLVSVVAQTRIIRGGEHRMICSHLILFDAVPGPPATLLPLKLNRDAMYRVVLAGPFTKDQLVKVKEYHLVRQAVVMDVLHFYKANNGLYAEVSIDGDLIASLPVEDVLDDVIDEALGMDDKASAVDNEQAAVNGFSGDPDEGSSEHECAYVERSVLFTQTTSDMAPVNEKQVLESLKSKIHQRTPRANPAVPEFNVHTSNKISNYFEAGIDARMFPHLFPFGRGYTNERGRRVPVSKLQCCRFAQDRYFVMVSFDRFGLDRGFINSNFSTKVRPSMHTPVAKISHDDMRKGLENQDSRRFGRTPKNKFVNKAVGALLRSVEYSSSFVWGSNAERRMHRREAFATADHFGQPSLFVTITPNVDGTITLAYLAGGIHVKSLFDVEYFKHMPDKATMQQLAMNDNMASATLFDRSIKAFTNVVVGFDKTTGRPRKAGGLFGHVKAYFGMVETQGRGTLHLHLLAWVYGAPRSTSEFEARLHADPNYEKMVLKYSEGIVSNALPLDMLQTTCKSCEHVDPKYDALDPPSTAFEKPRRSEGAVPKEPIMAKCGHCNAMVSSQHLVRQALLHSRPTVWPVELPKLSQPAIEKYLDAEAAFLKSTAGKKYDPERAHDHMRASFQAYLAGTVHMESNVGYQELLAGARASLEESNTASNTYVAPDKDPFCLDPIYRELSSMPFGPNETRLPDETVLFVIATLASVLQVHWWSHCSSCFKQSRNTRGAHLSRYLFPRARVEVGRIGTSAILLVRKLGDEYINGYSDVILRAFKCNHDIQIMIGGAEMAERIYYACKYTTKDQQKVECRTALALAAFDTRIQRELSAAEGGEALSDEVKCRRRLASHMFNMTRKQEVAGPLCALYLLRESCAYPSHFYKKMSIRHVLKFLHHHSDTPFQLEVTTNIKNSNGSCSQLEESNASDSESSNDGSESDSSDLESDDEEDTSSLSGPSCPEESSVFVPVGPAEDYINRPDAMCKDISWFEFMSKYFRANQIERTSPEKLFMERHSLHESKCLGVHRLARIPVLTGGVRVPFFGDCLKPEERNFHAQVALVLFKSFRVLADLCPHGSTWNEAWEAFQPTMSTGCAEVYHFMQDYHVGRKMAAKTRTSREEEQDIQKENDDGRTEPYDFDNFDFENALLVASGHSAISHLDCDDALDTTLELYQAISSSEMSNQVRFPTTTPIEADIAGLVGGKSLDEASTITSSKYMSILGAWDQRLHCREQFASDVKGLKTWTSKKRVERVVTFENPSRVEEISDTSMAWSDELPGEIPTLVQVNVPGALDPSTMLYTGNLVERGKVPQALPDYAHISVVSNAFGLRMRQHLSFACIARALLQRWQLEDNGDLDPQSVATATSAIQLRMVLHGEGGTGKSHVIAAVQAFCNSWKRPFSIAKTAMTG